MLVVLPGKDFNETGFLTVKGELEKKNIQIFTASEGGVLCIGNHGMKVKADMNILNVHVNNFEALIFAGGNGVKELWNNRTLYNIAGKFVSAGRVTAAICRAPVILAKAGLLKDLNATCFPDDRKELEREGAVYKDQPVVIRKRIITGRDEGAAAEFAGAVLSMIGAI